jgi:DNA-binding protein HU-beta
MNKTELVEAIAKDAKVSKKDAEAVVNAFTANVTKELKKGEKVTLIGFGTFEVGKRSARTGRNPQTGETIKIKAAKTPKFKAGKALKDAVNGAKKK